MSKTIKAFFIMLALILLGGFGLYSLIHYPKLTIVAVFTAIVISLIVLMFYEVKGLLR